MRQRRTPATTTATTGARLSVIHGHPESLAALAEHNLLVNACMGEVMRAAIAGKW
jgi:hypothetical protein